MIYIHNGIREELFSKWLEKDRKAIREKLYSKEKENVLRICDKIIARIEYLDISRKTRNPFKGLKNAKRILDLCQIAMNVVKRFNLTFN